MKKRVTPLSKLLNSVTKKK